MKKIVLALFVVFGVVSCQEDPRMEVTPLSISFTQQGGTENISVSSNVTWTATVTGNGFSVSPASGTGDAVLSLKADAATSPDDQTGTLTIKSETLSATVTISQGAKNTLIVTGNNTIDAAGGAYTVTLQYNTTYQVEIAPAATAWIQYTGTKGLSSATLAFQVAANNGSERTGVITVKDAAGIAATQTITLTQKENPLRTALLGLYNALDGANWTASKKTNWNSEEPVETWGGVTIENGKLTKLNLSGFGLKGDLPALVSSFTDLTSLNLGSNPNLTGSLPSDMGNLVNLESFLAVTTGLGGQLPASMGNLTKMNNLQLSKNNISGTIPAEWAGMTELKNLGLYSTNLSTPLPEAIFTSWKHIGTLLLYDNQNMNGPLPEALGNMTTDNTIFNIQMYNCNFTGGIPESWGNIPDVSKQLYIYGNQLTEPVPISVQAHPSWTADKWDKMKDVNTHYVRTQQNGVYLNLAVSQYELLMALYNALDGDNWATAKKTNWNTTEPVETWGGVTVENGMVTKLNFSGFGLKGQLPAVIGEFTSLTSLNLGSNPNLTGPLPNEIGNLINLDALMAVTTGLEGPLPASMGNLSKLTNLQLNNNNITGTLPAEWAGMTALKSFGMFNTKISGPLPEAIFTGWKHIGSMLLNNNPNLSGPLPEGLGTMTTDNSIFNIHMYECNFTGGIPASWGNIPQVSKQLRVYGNKLTQPVPAAVQNHPSWTSDKWDSYKLNTDIHYIRTQQNNVFLDLATIE